MLLQMRRLDIRATDLAERLSVGRSAVSDWIHGRFVPDVHRWREIAEILEVEPGLLLDWFVPE